MQHTVFLNSYNERQETDLVGIVRLSPLCSGESTDDLRYLAITVDGMALSPVYALDRNRHKMIEDHEDRERNHADTKAPANQLLLDRKQRLRGVVRFTFEFGLRHFWLSLPGLSSRAAV